MVKNTFSHCCVPLSFSCLEVVDDGDNSEEEEGEDEEGEEERGGEGEDEQGPRHRQVHCQHTETTTLYVITAV